MSAQAGKMPLAARVPISIGELVDKISILEIKAQRIGDPDKLANVRRELDLLCAAQRDIGLDTSDMREFLGELKAINLALWEIEDEIRELDSKREFGPRFVDLAQKVYRLNDRRSQIKRLINDTFGSAIVEEKSYKGAPTRID